MNRIKNYEKLEKDIVIWLNDYMKLSEQKGWVLGVSGGVDSAVVSTLVAKTDYPVMLLEIPIKQAGLEVTNAKKHIDWLKENHSNVSSIEISLIDEGRAFDVNYFDELKNKINKNFDLENISEETQHLAEANMRSRMRMMMLYHFAGLHGYIVIGTGNKVEDFGVGFYTKYGDGGVDISPIADLYKTEVRALGEYMGVSGEILNIAPTDGLWDDGRTDEDQLGATYEELEWAMEMLDEHHLSPANIFEDIIKCLEDANVSLNDKQKNVIKILNSRNRTNQHKILPIPMFYLKVAHIK